MNDQEILNALSIIESTLYYRINDREGLEDVAVLKTFHQKINDALKEWHNITGLTIS